MPDLDETSINIAQIYAGLTREKQAEAEEDLRRYLALVRRVYEYIQTENPKVLTELRRRARLRKRRQKSA
jgi:5-bromo-4-chloroindolyl phosphate hydrolysis protein